ncbi:MAG: hypothetical protein AAF680_11035 [Pseudomonadota bacterium]
MNIGDLEVEQVAALVCETLENYGIAAVLTGGSCVSVWTNNEYASNDLDFIVLGLASNKRLAKILSTIGFERRTSSPRYFEHAETHLVVEFPSGPLMVGDQQIHNERIDQRTTDVGVLRLLSPTDCIKDRLAAYYYWKDEQCLDQALMVTESQTVNWEDLRHWHEAEELVDRFAEFREKANHRE